MKKETGISVLICVTFLVIAGWLYLRSDDSHSSGEGQWISSAGTAEPVTQSSSEAAAGTLEQECTVYICGAVKHPGVYRFAAAARVCDAVQAAGGFTKRARQDAVNQARLLADGEQITIPVRKKSSGAARAGEQAEASASTEGLVNINTAELSELMTLSGIGEAKAQLILDYRRENGGFTAVEDIMKISGIKEGIYNQIKDRITV